MRTFLALGFAATLAVSTSACGSAQSAAAANGTSVAQEVTVVGTEMAFTPSTIEVQAGRPVKLTLRNNGAVEHNWQAKIGNETVLVTARPQQSANKTFTPTTPGTYEFICSVPGHDMAGMKGTLIVR